MMPSPECSSSGTQSLALSVSELTAQIKELVEPAFQSVWVVGEISNYSRPQSGHVYLTLKDERAQIGATLWRNQAQRVRFKLEDGLEVFARGYVSIYAPHGKYQLIVQQIQPKGMGALELAFRQLRDKLQREGLFDARHKKPLPPLPRRVVLVTSPTGAAVRDLLQVMLRRWPGLEIWIRPVPVQGDGAAAQIVGALEQVDRIKGVDVVVLARGGGSLEDLWAFNDEQLARSIFAMNTPLVSAIGHEIDVTLADLVADKRALTPSEAGELVAPDREELLAGVRTWHQRLRTVLEGRICHRRLQLGALAARPVLRRPAERIYELGRRCDELAHRARRAIGALLRDRQHCLQRQSATLESLSPLQVLGRGYSLTYREDGKRLLTRANMVSSGELIVTRLAEGTLLSRVERCDPLQPGGAPQEQPIAQRR